MENRRKFSAEFKQEAVRSLKTSGKSAAVIARELGIPRNRIYKWAADVDAAGTKAFAGSGRPKLSQDEFSVLQRENARLREENELLKKAAAYFARELA